jgi:hypothetical protein
MNNNWRNNLKKNYPIDAMDGDDIWYEAIITDVIKNKKRGNLYLVRYYGWSEKWNIEVDKYDNRIAPRNSKVPNWKKLIKKGYCLEYRSDKKDPFDNLNSTWSNGICISIDENDILTILSSKGNEEKYIKIHRNSPDIAESYTHCGYVHDVSSKIRNLFLCKKRKINKIELQILKENEENKEFKNLSKKLSNIFNNPIESNIKFIVEDKVIYAHRIILIAHSKYFECLFSKKFKDYNNTEIIIDDYEYNIFYNFIKFIYTGYINLNNLKIYDIYKFYILAEYYNIDNLKQILINKYLINNISIENVFNIYSFADKYDIKKLLKKTLIFIIKNKNLLEKKNILLNIKIDISSLLLFDEQNMIDNWILHKKILDHIKKKV